MVLTQNTDVHTVKHSKTVIPFCTAASSGIGDSGNLLEEMAETGNWLEGERFRGGTSEADISAWINSLGL